LDLRNIELFIYVYLYKVCHNFKNPVSKYSSIFRILFGKLSRTWERNGKRIHNTIFTVYSYAYSEIFSKVFFTASIKTAGGSRETFFEKRRLASMKSYTAFNKPANKRVPREENDYLLP